MRSLSPLAIRVGWVIFDRSDGCRAPLLDRLQLGPERLCLDLRRGRRCAPRGADERLRGGLAGGVAVEEQELLRVRPGQGGAQDVPVGDADDLVDVLAAAGPVPVRTSLRTRSGCSTRSWAIMPPREKEKTSILSNPSAVMNA